MAMAGAMAWALGYQSDPLLQDGANGARVADVALAEPERLTTCVRSDVDGWIDSLEVAETCAWVQRVLVRWWRARVTRSCMSHVRSKHWGTSVSQPLSD